MKKDKKSYQINWKYNLSGSPKALWPLFRNTNRLFHYLGFKPIQRTLSYMNDNNGLTKVGYAGSNSRTFWDEEPFIWEEPFMIGSTRFYKSGIFKQLKFLFTLNHHGSGTSIDVDFHYTPALAVFALPIKLYFSIVVRRKLIGFLRLIDKSAANNLSTFETGTKHKLARNAKKTLLSTRDTLVESTKQKQIVSRFSDFLLSADDEEMKAMNPYDLAKQWGKNKYDVLDVFLHAVKTDLLRFKWNTHCSKCKMHTHEFDNLRDIDEYLYCKHCNADYQIDFSKNVVLSFSASPTIRKISRNLYSAGGPQEEPGRVSQHYLKPGEKQYLNLSLKEGNYYFKTNINKGFLKFVVSEDGDDPADIIVGDEQFLGKAFNISKEPNLLLINDTDENMLAFFEKPFDSDNQIYASEITSMQKFRTLFPTELIKDGVKMMASNLSILFTDIINSTDLYLQEGDDFAVDQVMNHFKIIQQVVTEEHGTIVKTIGDSVMAVFREPASALTAMDRINHIFSTTKALGISVKLKAGIHIGDCTTVSINDRIDYFGTTVNMASRLVDAAKEKEIVVSEAFFNHSEVQDYLEKNRNNLFIRTSEIRLKGFDNEVFNVKQIRMEPSAMRLVV